ncbi:hypothetical protein RYX36_020551 [Vicia faba]
MVHTLVTSKLLRENRQSLLLVLQDMANGAEPAFFSDIASISGFSVSSDRRSQSVTIVTSSPLSQRLSFVTVKTKAARRRLNGTVWLTFGQQVVYSANWCKAALFVSIACLKIKRREWHEKLEDWNRHEN